jgi:hypothetical protein
VAPWAVARAVAVPEPESVAVPGRDSTVTCPTGIVRRPRCPLTATTSDDGALDDRLDLREARIVGGGPVETDLTDLFLDR